MVGVFSNQSLECQLIRLRDLQAFTQTQRSAIEKSSSTRLCDIDEIVGFAVWTIFQRDKTGSQKSNNVLCHGVRRTAPVSLQGKSLNPLCLPGIFVHASTVNIDILRQRPWTLIPELVGNEFEKIFTSLLLDSAIFMAIPSGRDNLYQLCGTPFFQLSKRPKLNRRNKQTIALQTLNTDTYEPIAQNPSSVLLARNRVFYAKPSISKSGKVQLGLKQSHVLNQYSQVDQNHQDFCMLRCIFPRFFNLHNIFDSQVDSITKTHSWPKAALRDSEKEQCSTTSKYKIPRRLRGPVQNLVRKIRRNHEQCSYIQLLLYYCPSSGPKASHVVHKFLKNRSLSGLQADQISRLKHNLQTALSTNDSNLFGSVEESYLSHATPAFQVSAFCKATLRALLPPESFGIGQQGVSNWKRILSMVDTFIVSRRFETFTLHEVLHGLSLKVIAWLRPMRVLPESCMSASDKTKRLELLQDLIYFLFDTLLIPLIRSNFYVTETGVYRNRLFYFRQDVWRKLSEPSLTTLRMGTFKLLNPRQLRQAIDGNKLGVSSVRLLPKQAGVRPITNLRSRAMKIVNGKRLLTPSINSALTSVFNVLKFERDRQPGMLGSSLFSVGDIGRQLSLLHSIVRSKEVQKLFFVKVDIRSCFDTIPQEALLNLVTSMFGEAEYLCAKHVESKYVGNQAAKGKEQVVSRFISRTTTCQNSRAFCPDVAHQNASSRRQTVFTGIDQENRVLSKEVKKLLNDHVCNNIVRIGSKHFRQADGIPQGSVLSSLLCSLFYSEFERCKLGFLDEGSSLLLRFIDDFLLITTDKTQAHRFVLAMSEGHTEYGIMVNAEKSLVNFEVAVNGHKVPRTHGTDFFPYCGLNIHMKTLEVSKDRQRRDVHIGNALTISIHGPATRSFQRRLLSSFKIQMHGILFDRNFNSKSRIMTSLFSNFVETTMKLHQYRTNMPRSRRPSIPSLVALCGQMMSLAYKMISGAQSSPQAPITRAQVFRVGASAMIKVLSRKQSNYRQLLKWLSEIDGCTRQSAGVIETGMATIIRDGIAPFKDYVY